MHSSFWGKSGEKKCWKRVWWNIQVKVAILAWLHNSFIISALVVCNGLWQVRQQTSDRPDLVDYTCQRKRNDAVQIVPAPLYLANSTLHMNSYASNLLRGYNFILSRRCSCRCRESRDVQQNVVFHQQILDTLSPVCHGAFACWYVESCLTREIARASNPDNLWEIYLLTVPSVRTWSERTGHSHLMRTAELVYF